MKSKKLLTLALIVVLVLSFAACSSSKPAEQPAAAEPTAAPTAEPTTAPVAESGLKDGSYSATQDNYDDYGWKGQIAIEVKDGKISTVDFDYVNKDNKLKSQDQGYIKSMEDQTKINLAKAMEELEGKLVGKQDAAAVDAVAGATTTSNDFNTLAGKALEGAK